MSATIRLTFESVQNAQAKTLILKTMAFWARGWRTLTDLGPLLRFCGMYSLGFATCFPAFKAFENAMSFTGVVLLAVAFLIVLGSFETQANSVGTDDLI